MKTSSKVLIGAALGTGLVWAVLAFGKASQERYAAGEASPEVYAAKDQRQVQAAADAAAYEKCVTETNYKNSLKPRPVIPPGEYAHFGDTVLDARVTGECSQH